MPTAEKSQYEVGSLVLLRGREWVVIPSDGGVVIRLRPLSGREEETIGVHRLLEEHQLKPATFPDPDPSAAGDFIGGQYATLCVTALARCEWVRREWRGKRAQP